MDINVGAVLTAAVIAMVVGAIWYGPLFGNKWLEILGVRAEDKEARAKMKKSAGPLYGVQFVLNIFQVFVLAYFVGIWPGENGVVAALLIWAAFVVSVLAGVAMWNNDSAKVSWTRFGIQSGYQLVIFLIFGIILTFWK